MKISKENPLLLLGAGNMGKALLNGWLAKNLDPSTIFVVDPNLTPEVKHEFLEKRVQIVENNQINFKPAVALLAVKSQIMQTVLHEIQGYLGKSTLIVSIAAGITISEIETALGAQPIIRVMPNTPAQVKRGMSAMYCNQHVSEQQQHLATELMISVGELIWLESEDQVDLVTGLSGTGPAYVFLLTECLTNAGKRLGLSDEIATKLATQTVAGAGELMYQTETSPATLRKNVTSPGGTTEAALKILNATPGLQSLLDSAVDQAVARARELGNK